jgi:hypothetical protein
LAPISFTSSLPHFETARDREGRLAGQLVGIGIGGDIDIGDAPRLERVVGANMMERDRGVK